MNSVQYFTTSAIAQSEGEDWGGVGAWLVVSLNAIKLGIENTMIIGALSQCHR